MKLSKTTIEILKNFADIGTSKTDNQSGISVDIGNSISIISPSGTILAISKVEENFDIPFCLYNLDKFIKLYKLFQYGDIQFTQDHLILKNINSTLEYYYSDKDSVKIPPLNVKIPENALSFELSKINLNLLKDASDDLGFKLLKIHISDNRITATLNSIKNSDKNVFSLYLGMSNQSTEDCDITFNIDNFKFVDGDYVVTLGKKFAHFKYVQSAGIFDNQLQYWVSANIDED